MTRTHHDLAGIVMPGLETSWVYVSPFQEVDSQILGPDGLWSLGVDRLEWLARALDTSLGDLGMVMRLDDLL